MKPNERLHYSHWDVLLADPVAPMHIDRRTQQLTIIWQGLAALETAGNPLINDWRVCSDPVNMMETLIKQGVVADPQGLLADATTALAQAAKRHIEQGHPIRLSGPGITAVRAILEDYATVIAELPERRMVQCHRDTEKRIRAINNGQRQAHDVEVVAL